MSGDDAGPERARGRTLGIGSMAVDRLARIPRILAAEEKGALRPLPSGEFSEVRVGGDSGKPITVTHPDSSAAKALTDIAQEVAAKVSVAALGGENAVSIDIVE